jgi:hypothetical protein
VNLRALAVSLGIPAHAVVVEKATPFTEAATLRDNVRPVLAGVEISSLIPYDATYDVRQYCTMGFNAYSGAIRGFVTNSHCTATAVLDGTVFYQGGTTASYAIGVEAIDPGFRHSSQWQNCGYCPAGSYCRWSDAAFVAYGDTVASLHAAIARPTGGYGSISFGPGESPFRVIQEQSYPLVGQYVHRVGATSGLVRAQVSLSCIDTYFIATNGHELVKLCQDKALVLDPPGTAMQGGDSGAPVFFDLGGHPDARLVGIAWGYNTALPYEFTMSSLWNIEQDLGPLATYLTF